MFLERADIATRLIEERTSAGYSQADFARQLDISREGLRLYENGQRELKAEFLAKAASLGIDVQYVLTGVKSKNISEVYKNNQHSAQPIINISGGQSNIVQSPHAGSVTNQIITQKHITNTKAEVLPGEKHITEEQASKLTLLVNEIVDLEKKLKKSPRTYRGVWSALNSHCKVTRYRLIPLVTYSKAEKYLYSWIGRLNSMKSAPSNLNSEWRKRKYAYIKINTKHDQEWLNSYLARKYGATSITELDDKELDTAYRAVAGRKNK